MDHEEALMVKNWNQTHATAPMDVSSGYVDLYFQRVFLLNEEVFTFCSRKIHPSPSQLSSQGKHTKSVR